MNESSDSDSYGDEFEPQLSTSHTFDSKSDESYSNFILIHTDSKQWSDEEEGHSSSERWTSGGWLSIVLDLDINNFAEAVGFDKYLPVNTNIYDYFMIVYAK